MITLNNESLGWESLENLGPLENLASSLNLALGLLLAPLPPHDLGRPQKTAHRGGEIYHHFLRSRKKGKTHSIFFAKFRFQ